MDGQTDIFGLLDESPPLPPFTVHTCVWLMSQCGWCNDRKGFLGGGGTRNPDDENESWYYEYCHSCQEKYGTPKLSDPNLKIIVDRTQIPRPGDAPNLSGKKETS